MNFEPVTWWRIDQERARSDYWQQRAYDAYMVCVGLGLMVLGLAVALLIAITK